MVEGIMDQSDITCCFTGHRPVKLPWGMRDTDSRCTDTKIWIRDQVSDLYEKGYRRFLCGMAIGCDMLFAEEVTALRRLHPEVILFGAIPCADQASCWNTKQKLRYSELVEQCDEIKIFSETYNRLCMNERNSFMVEQSSVLLACFNGTPGGTMNTILYAQRKGIDIRIFDLNRLIRDESRETSSELTH